MDTILLSQNLRRDEGEVLHAYQDSRGFWTIGVGICLDARAGGGISIDESTYLLDNRIRKIVDQIGSLLPWWNALDEVRQRVLCNMAYQLGISGLLGFHVTLALIKAGKYTEASEHMLTLPWAEETPARAHRMSVMMSTGKDIV